MPDDELIERAERAEADLAEALECLRQGVRMERGGLTPLGEDDWFAWAHRLLAKDQRINQ